MKDEQTVVASFGSKGQTRWAKGRLNRTRWRRSRFAGAGEASYPEIHVFRELSRLDSGSAGANEIAAGHCRGGVVKISS